MVEVIKIYSVRDYINKKQDSRGFGKQMFAFNDGLFHLSYEQLKNANVPVPQLLQDTEMRIEWFDVGEKLLNGAAVTDARKIVKNFTPTLDKELFRQIALEKTRERVSMWDSVTVRRAGNDATGLAPTGATGTQNAMAGTGSQVVTRNAQLDDNGNPIVAQPQYDEQGNLIPADVTAGAAATTNASIGQPAEQVA